MSYCADVLHLLVVGETRTVIASALRVSPRTVDLRVHRIKQALGTPHRFCLGVRAVRHGVVKPQHPIAHAIGRRPGAGWTRPTVRQHEVLCLFAAGLSADEVSERMGMSVNTVRHEISRLALANGARNIVHAGALFEAHSWI